MKKGEEAMEILEASDATGSLRAAAALAGCDHKTVARLVAARDVAGGGLPERARQRPLVDPFAAKIDEQVDRSRALVRADVVHGVLVAMGYAGSYRTTRRAVAKAKRRWRNRHGRRTRPWIPQPGLWLQWDYGDGPEVAGVRAVVLCAWLAWSRFRVVVPFARQDAAQRSDRLGSHAACRGWRADVCVDRQQEDGDGRSRVRDRGAERDDR